MLRVRVEASLGSEGIDDLRRLRLHRRTDAERDQDGDGDEPGGVRHAGLSAQEDVMSNPILLLTGGPM
jgi:hypothetical protein